MTHPLAPPTIIELDGVVVANQGPRARKLQFLRQLRAEGKHLILVVGSPAPEKDGSIIRIANLLAELATVSAIRPRKEWTMELWAYIEHLLLGVLPPQVATTSVTGLLAKLRNNSTIPAHRRELWRNQLLAVGPMVAARAIRAHLKPFGRTGIICTHLEKTALWVHGSRDRPEICRLPSGQIASPMLALALDRFHRAGAIPIVTGGLAREIDYGDIATLDRHDLSRTIDAISELVGSPHIVREEARDMNAHRVRASGDTYEERARYEFFRAARRLELGLR